MKLTAVKLATKEVYRLDWDPVTGRLDGDADLVADVEAMGRACQRDGYVSLFWLGTHTLKGSPLKDAQSLQWLLAMLGLGSPDLPPLPEQEPEQSGEAPKVY